MIAYVLSNNDFLADRDRKFLPKGVAINLGLVHNAVHRIDMHSLNLFLINDLWLIIDISPLAFKVSFVGKY
ncbi:hypothetical protein A0E43_19055 [Pectobacterium cacticida]